MAYKQASATCRTGLNLHIGPVACSISSSTRAGLALQALGPGCQPGSGADALRRADDERSQKAPAGVVAPPLERVPLPEGVGGIGAGMYHKTSFDCCAVIIADFPGTSI